jgi:hypothetical protein
MLSCLQRENDAKGSETGSCETETLLPCETCFSRPARPHQRTRLKAYVLKMRGPRQLAHGQLPTYSVPVRDQMAQTSAIGRPVADTKTDTADLTPS